MFPYEKTDLGKVSYDKPSSEFQGHEKDQKKPCFSEFGGLNSLYFQNMSNQGTDFQLEGIKKASPFASFGIVKDYASRSRKLNGEKIHVPGCNDESREANDQTLSTNARIRIAGQYFIDFYSSKSDVMFDLSHPFSGLADDEAKDIELLLTLLASAEKTGQRQFDHARELIELCNKRSSNEGNPVQRLVYYFSEAIREKIKREMGCDGLEMMKMCDLHRELMKMDDSILAFHQKVPLSQLCQFTAMQTIIENVRDARKIHVIDFEIRSGMQYTVLMQGIASHHGWKIEQLKLTVISTRLESKIKVTCNRLVDAGRSMNIPFSFKIVMIEDMLDFNINLLELDNNEKVVVSLPFALTFLIVRSNRLEHLMREIRKINPCITTVTEVEANLTSPVFVNRFIEALFFYGALFDSSSDCLANDEHNRKIGESFFYANSIRNILAAEGDERTLRHVTIDVWRAFFARFGMVEIELSAQSFNEARLLIDNYDCGNSCLLRFDGPCFVVGWKGVSIFSVSAWKFV